MHGPARWIAALWLALPNGALAQDELDAVIGVAPARGESAVVAAPLPPAPRAAMLEEIIVTAERRVASLQDTPISIEAFDAEAIEQRGIKGVQDLGGQVPGLTLEPFPTHNATLRLFIRGVGINDAQLTQDPAVGVYIDGVYVARSVGLALDVADLERIEVLRGPQGTLYGRNTTGGAVNLITRKPQVDGFAMSHTVSGGERNRLSARSSINLPVTDTFALGVAVLGSTGDGFVDNAGPGADFGDREEFAGRLAARWMPTSELTADYAFDHSDTRYVNAAFQPVLLPNTNKGAAELFKPYAVSQSVYSDRRLERLATGMPMEASGTRIDGHALTLTAALGAHELKYIGAYRELRDRQYADLGGGAGSTTYRVDSHAYDGPAALTANGGPTPLVIPTVTQEQWSHELQLSGRLLDDALQYVVGVFHFAEEGREDRNRLNHNFSSIVPLDQLDELSTSLPELDPLLGLPGIDFNQVEVIKLVNFVNLDWTIDNEAVAAFGQATWTPPVFDERLHLTAGYRHSRDERRAEKFRISDTYLEVQTSGVGIGVPLSSAERFDHVPAARAFDDDAFSFVAAFDLSDTLNVYAKSVESYKSGGFNVRDPNVSGATADPAYGVGFTDGFDPEFVHSVELGLKSEWLGRRLRANFAAFRADYENMQINFLIPGTISDTKTINAGRARMRGAEVDLTALITPELTLIADYAYLDAEVQEVLDPAGNNVADLYPFTSAPRHSGVLAADWTLWRASLGELRAFVSYNYTDVRQGQVITEDRRGLTSIPAYGLWNARLTAAGLPLGRHGTLDLAVHARNLADEVYPVIAIDNLPHADRAVVWGEPRYIGLELVYRYR
ncbi:TonB-dependent receptor [Sinimarinibacterium thermocellulolyticum]|uniref:TonB-dependent receptor n=1 Tax=Sinimarinibacterium thermocellulolyticum TaxID=3170016 RepID=A0ABV2AD23_9GAMM